MTWVYLGNLGYLGDSDDLDDLGEVMDNIRQESGWELGHGTLACLREF